MSVLHKKNRRIIEWAFPGRLASLSEAWDGVEDYQDYLDRAASWSGSPVTATEMTAQVSAYDAMIAAKNNPTVLDVKSEANQRIIAVYPITKQLNMAMRATELQEKRIDGGTLTTEEQAEADALKAAATWIKSIRTASDVIEALSPIPADYAVDSRWPD